MKKIFALAMVLVSMAAGMTSCSNGEADDVMAPKPTQSINFQSNYSSNTKNGVTTTNHTVTDKGQTVTTQTISTSGTSTYTNEAD